MNTTSVSHWLSPLRWFVGLAVLTVLLAVTLPVDPAVLARLHATPAAYRLGVLVLLVPYVIIWYFSFLAYSRLRTYRRYLKDAAECRAFDRLTLGMEVLTFGLVVPTMVSLLLKYLAIDHPAFTTAAVVLPNYLTIAAALSSFLLMGSGAHLLTISAKLRPSLRGIRLFVLGFIVVGVFFSYLTIHNDYTSGHPYGLPLLLLILTFIVPYLYTWFMGLFCAYELRLYAGKVRGVLYRRGLAQLSIGISVVVGGSIALQFVAGALAANKHISLLPVLLTQYGLLVVLVVGFLLMARGTTKLKKIEEV